MAKPKETPSDRLVRLLAYDAEQGQAHNASTPLCVIGVDEVGRGSLVGPVVAAAYCFMVPPCVETHPILTSLDDSKAAHLNHRKRVALAQTLYQTGAWGIGEASPEEIASLNIVKASLLAGYRAIEHLLTQFETMQLKTSLVLMDGKQTIPHVRCPQKAVVKGDSHSAAIAAASIIAKAERDTRLIAWSQDYPEYGWDTNAGYPTPQHQQAILDHGISPLHRRNYKQIRDWLAENTQLSLLPG